jgi:hypothetical protein
MTEISKQNAKLLTTNPIWIELMEWMDSEVQKGAVELLDMEEVEYETQKTRLKAWKDLKAKMLAKVHNSL